MTVLILIGAIAGLVMGAVGVGGGAIIIFCLSVLAKFPQKIAQGTTLFIVAAPISLAVHLPSSVLKVLLGIMLMLMGARLIFSGWASIS